MSKFYGTVIAATVALLAAGGARAQQAVVTSNEPVKGRLAGTRNEVHVYGVEVKEDDQKLSFKLSCKSAILKAYVFRVRDNKQILILRENIVVGEGVQHYGAYGNNIDCSVGPLSKGVYRIMIYPATAGDSGTYSLTVTAPEMKGGGGGGDAAAELKQIRKDVQTLLDRLDRLEKKMKGK